MIKKIKGIVFFLIVISFSFCGSLSAEVIDRIVAIVDSDIVTLVQLNKNTSLYIKKIESSGYSDEKKKQLIREVNEKALNDMIDSSLTQQEARKYRVDVSEVELDNSVENARTSRSMTQEEFIAALGKEGLTIDEYRETVRKQILQARLINHAVKSKVAITESDIKEVYDANAEKYSGKKKYHLRNILMDSEDKIKDVKKKLDNKNFISLAKQYSIASNASDGGDLGLFDITNFSDNIKESLLKLKKGGFTNIIKTPQGFQIFYVQDILFSGNITYEQAHDEIRDNLYREKVQAKFKTWLDSLKKKAHIKIML